jgi:hypothetical protein
MDPTIVGFPCNPHKQNQQHPEQSEHNQAFDLQRKPAGGFGRE